MYNILVYSDEEKHLKAIRQFNFDGPMLEMRLPFERLSYCNQEEVNNLAKELGVKILQFMNSAEQSPVENKPKKIYPYTPLSKEDYEEAFMVRGIDVVEEEVDFGGM